VIERVRAARERKFGPGAPETLSVMYRLGKAYRTAGRRQEAIRVWEQIREWQLATYKGSRFSPTLVTALAEAYWADGRPQEAERVWTEVVSRVRAKAGPRNLSSLLLVRYWVYHLTATGQFSKAVEVSGESLALCREGLAPEAAKVGPPDHPVSSSAILYGNALLDAGRFTEAEPVLREALDYMEHVNAGNKQKGDAWVADALRSRLGEALHRQGRHAEAEPLLLAGYAGMKEKDEKLPIGDRNLSNAAERLVRLYTALGRPDEAMKWQAERAKYPPETLPAPRESKDR